MVQVNDPIFNLLIYRVLKGRYKLNCAYQTSYMIEYMKRRFPAIPKIVYFEALREMESMGLVRRINHKSYCLLFSDSVKKIDQLTSSPLW